MGYRDYKLMLSKNHTVTEEVSDYYVDTELTVPPWEKGWPLEVCITVETAGTGTTGFVIYLLQNASTAPTLGSDTLASITVPIAQCTKGAELKIRFPEGVALERYVGLHYANITGDESMVVSAYIQPVTS